MSKNRRLSCDWGTSNFRLYLINASTVDILAEHSTHHGIAAINTSYLNSPEENRVDHFCAYLHDQIKVIEDVHKTDLADVPIIISGMASSSIGITELPYAHLPISFNRPQLEIRKVKSDQLTQQLYVVSGLQSSEDVMRGEETQVIGLQQLINSSSCICILPGTHSKHIYIENGEIINFDTYMTGELFQLISQQSILQYSLSAPTSNLPISEHHFAQGVIEGSKTLLLKQLFKIRAKHLLEDNDPSNNYAYLSGLLIGHELSSLTSTDLYLCSNGRLSQLYQSALSVLGLDTNLVVIPSSAVKMAIPRAHIQLLNNL